LFVGESEACLEQNRQVTDLSAWSVVEPLKSVKFAPTCDHFVKLHAINPGGISLRDGVQEGGPEVIIG
jgi:hypothetical protein